MSEHDFGPERPSYLLPCPFCSGGEYRGSATHLPPRMDGPGALISFTIRHWCHGSVSGAVKSSREVRAAEPDWAIQEWNRRADGEAPGLEVTEAICLDKLKRERDEARAEAARYKTRLELDHCYDSGGNAVPWPDGVTPIDGIACRDETIKGQDDQIAGLVRERHAYREATKLFLMAALQETPERRLEHLDAALAKSRTLLSQSTEGGETK